MWLKKSLDAIRVFPLRFCIFADNVVNKKTSNIILCALIFDDKS